MCEVWAQHFSSVFDSNPAPVFNIELPESTLVNLSVCSFTASEIKSKLDSLDISKGFGPDGIPPSVLRSCSAPITPLLQALFNKSVATGTFPDILKSSYIVPIFKSGSLQDATNYRPIAIQSVVAKVFESLILDKIKPHLKSVIVQEQHGFCEGRSTVTNLTIFQEYIMSAFNEGFQVDAIFFYFAKAFDRVNHEVLLYKLGKLGISSPLLNFFRSYLLHRRLAVRHHGAISGEFVATSGVPQGALLAPLLFILFVNDIGRNICVRYLLFADDLKIFIRITNATDCISLQSAINSIQDWCDSNLMSINPNKCCTVTFNRCLNPIVHDYTLNDVNIVRKTEIRDLGVWLTSSLNPQVHIINICNRANKTLGFIIRTTRGFTDLATLRILYCTLVRSILEYCSVVWNPYQVGHTKMLQDIQDRFLRVVGTRLGYSYKEVPIAHIARILDLPTLARRRTIQGLLFLFKLLNSQIDCSELLQLVHFRTGHRTRSIELFARLNCARSYLRNGVMTRIQRHGNEVAAAVDFFADGTGRFRRLVNELIT